MVNSHLSRCFLVNCEEHFLGFLTSVTACTLLTKRFDPNPSDMGVSACIQRHIREVKEIQPQGQINFISRKVKFRSTYATTLLILFNSIEDRPNVLTTVITAFSNIMIYGYLQATRSHARLMQYNGQQTFARESINSNLSKDFSC